jgi:MraZ protein
MLRGNHTARIDDKGRLKIPTHFRRRIEEKYGSEVFVTSLTGESVNIFPLAEWEKIEQKLSLLPSNEAARRVYLTRMNFYGQEAEIDNQGRVLIHPLLREKTDAYGDVAVIGALMFLDVWNRGKMERFIQENPFTEEHEAILARMGI